MSDSNWLIHDHRKYQAALEACDIAAGVREWKEAVQLFNAFVDELNLHMWMEDEVLYPFFKEEAGDPAIVIKHKDYDHFEECLKPLYQALVEHNSHEEAVFSRMSGHALLNRRDEILRRLEALHPGTHRRV